MVIFFDFPYSYVCWPYQKRWFQQKQVDGHPSWLPGARYLLFFKPGILDHGQSRFKSRAAWSRGMSNFKAPYMASSICYWSKCHIYIYIYVTFVVIHSSTLLSYCHFYQALPSVVMGCYSHSFQGNSPRPYTISAVVVRVSGRFVSGCCHELHIDCIT